MASAVGKASLSGALPGAVLGGGESFLAGSPATQIGKKALMGALIGGGTAGAATGIGSAIMGAPEEGDPTGYATRGAVGGLVGGGLAGAGLGAAAAMGKVGIPEKISKSALAHYIENLRAKGGLGAVAAGAGLGASLGGLFGGYQGWSEGGGVDSMQNTRARARMKTQGDTTL